MSSGFSIEVRVTSGPRILHGPTHDAARDQYTWLIQPGLDPNNLRIRITYGTIEEGPSNKTIIVWRRSEEA